MFEEPIEAVRVALLDLHKTLIDLARADHERAHQRSLTPGQLLQLLTSDTAFDWLHPFSKLVIAIDELLERDIPPSQRDAAAVRLEVERLISDETNRYAASVERDPNVAVQHGRTMAALEKLPPSELSEHASLLELRSTWRGTKRRRAPAPKTLN